MLSKVPRVPSSGTCDFTQTHTRTGWIFEKGVTKQKCHPFATFDSLSTPYALFTLSALTRHANNDQGKQLSNLKKCFFVCLQAFFNCLFGNFGSVRGLKKSHISPFCKWKSFFSKQQFTHEVWGKLKMQKIHTHKYTLHVHNTHTPTTN